MTKRDTQRDGNSQLGKTERERVSNSEEKRLRDLEKEVQRDDENRTEEKMRVSHTEGEGGSYGGQRERARERKRQRNRERESAPDPVFDISPCSVDKGCHPLVLRALTAVCSHHPSPAQETIDQRDSTALACICV